MNPLGLTDSELATLAEAIRITDAQPLTHISPDDCQRCGGHGCDECRDCQCSQCRKPVPDYIRDSINRWRPE